DPRVLVEIAAVALLAARRQRPAEAHELLGPFAQWHFRATRIDPRAAHLVGLHLDEEALRVGLPGERSAVLPAQRIAVPRPVAGLARALLDVAHVVDHFLPTGGQK